MAKIHGSWRGSIDIFANNKFSFKGEIPKGVSLEENAKYGEKTRHDSWTKTGALLDFMNLVKSGGKMDYKRLDEEALKNKTPSKYEDFGNYNYGVVARAMRIDENFAKACAGAYQATQIMQRALKNKEKTFASLSEADRKKYEPYFEEALKIEKNINLSTSKSLLRHFINKSMEIGNKTGNYGYFDDPKDQEFITQGYKDAKKLGYGNEFEPIEFKDMAYANGKIGDLLFSQNKKPHLNNNTELQSKNLTNQNEIDLLKI